MRKEVVLSAIGVASVSVSIGLLLGVVGVMEDFSGIAEGSYVRKEPVLAVIYLSLIATILGTIGGYLIGRYISRVFADASHSTT